jgi:hypothetical protein
MKSFKKCCVSIALDGTDVDMLWKGSKEDWNVKRWCVEDQSTTECEDGDRDTGWYRWIESDLFCVLSVCN